MVNKYNRNYYTFNRQNRDRIGNLFYSNIIKKNFKIKNYLDFGCGVGFLLKRLEKFDNIKTYGYEINKFAINECANNTKKTKIYKNLKEIDKKFDLISMIHIVEHIESEELKDLFYTLKKNLS